MGVVGGSVCGRWQSGRKTHSRSAKSTPVLFSLFGYFYMNLHNLLSYTGTLDMDMHPQEGAGDDTYIRK